MNENWTIDLIWWITVVELPALGSLFWMIWKNRQDMEKSNDVLRDHCDEAIQSNREALSGYKLEVAKNYASINYLKDVERRLTGHLVRIENKLDQTTRQVGQGNQK